MKISVSFSWILLSSLIPIPALAGSSGGSGPPQRVVVSVEDFEHLARSSRPIVDEVFLTKAGSTQGRQRSYWIDDGDRVDELILRERRERMRQAEEGSIVRILKAQSPGD